jgi:hypothetical protein
VPGEGAEQKVQHRSGESGPGARGGLCTEGSSALPVPPDGHLGLVSGRGINSGLSSTEMQSLKSVCFPQTAFLKVSKSSEARQKLDGNRLPLLRKSTKLQVRMTNFRRSDLNPIERDLAMVDRAGSTAFSRLELVPKFAALRKHERTKLRSD